jgi:hypothetical protein
MNEQDRLEFRDNKRIDREENRQIGNNRKED